MKSSRKIPVTWKNLFTFIKCPNRAQAQANAAAADNPNSAPLIISEPWTCKSISAVSIPSRVIIRNVKRNTPAIAAVRELRDETALKRVFIRS